MNNSSSLFSINIISDFSSPRSLRASGNETLLDLLRTFDIGPDAMCNGLGKCGKCTVSVTGRIRPVTGGDTIHADNLEIAACRFCPAGNLTVFVPESPESRVLTRDETKSSGQISRVSHKKGLGIAFDLGTTTIAAYLYDLASGEKTAETGERNNQRTFGADVISRIQACSDGNLGKLKEIILHQFAETAKKLCLSTGHELSEINVLSVAGNTVMEHIFSGISPESIGKSPFKPECLFGETQYVNEGSELRPYFPSLQELYISPCIAGYVGGDITAGMLASRLDRKEGCNLYIDIGTNGEMALGNAGEGYLTAAAAAGPAFEGAEIICGMTASFGAIDKVRVDNNDIAFHVIGDTEATGLCGSGLIDAVACLIDLKLVTPGGRLLDSHDPASPAYKRFKSSADSGPKFFLSENVYLTQKDIYKVQLAKAAIRAGIDTLFEFSGKSPKDLTSVIIAGGFGQYMSIESAIKIGLLPNIDRDKITHTGNASGKGASMLLDLSMRDRLKKFTGSIHYLELSESDVFSEYFMDEMGFEV